MTFIVPGVCRYTINGSMHGRKVCNVLDYQIDTTGSVYTRAEAVEQQAIILVSEWIDSVIPQLNWKYTAETISWVDLDDVDTTVGTITGSETKHFPTAGGKAEACQPSNVAVLVRKNVSGIRGARRGRMYLPAVGESFTDSDNSNTIRASEMTQYQTKMDSFLGDTNQDDPEPSGFQSQMVVVHITSREAPKPGQAIGNPLTGIHLAVSSLAVDPTLATQRRRLRG